jgi:hypothetical protein
MHVSKDSMWRVTEEIFWEVNGPSTSFMKRNHKYMHATLNTELQKWSRCIIKCTKLFLEWILVVCFLHYSVIEKLIQLALSYTIKDTLTVVLLLVLVLCG